MQAWGRRTTVCAFCSLRRGFLAQTATVQTRAIKVHRSSPDRKPSTGPPNGRDRVVRSSRSQRKGAREGRPVLHGSLKSTNYRVAIPLPAAVESAIKQVLKQLQTKSTATATAASPLETFDPDGQQWPEFVEHLRKLVVAHSPLDSEADTRLRQELVQAHGAGPDQLRITIKHAFFDAVLFSRPNSVTSVSAVADLRYPTEWYAKARMSQRVIHLHVGPTNSGKTYNALKRLEEAADGFFAGPLRLLAHEVYSRFRAAGIPCDLITGDDVRLDEDVNTKVAASTVEMVSTKRERAVAVIDEIQMMADDERGWAWTRAFLGAAVKELHLCGETRVIPLVRELTASMGDTLHVHRYDRLNQLKPMSRSLRGNLKNLRKGDAVVAFSVVEIHAMKKEIELQTGRRVAIVYGSLPPETRAKQAELFNDPDNDYDFLVASDAIGMGLNLSIKRIIFQSLTKWNGVKRVQLSIPQIKQIAGRAGRYRTAHQAINKAGNNSNEEAAVGLVTCLDEEELPVIHKALSTEPPPLRHAGVVPPVEIIEDFASRLPPGLPFEYILRRVCDTSRIHPRFKICDMRDAYAMARAIEDIDGLTIGQRGDLTAAPASVRDPTVRSTFRAYAKIVAQHRAQSIVDIAEIPLEVLNRTPSPDPTYLAGLESLHKCLILWLWLSYRFPMNFIDRPVAQHAKDITEERISLTLSAFSANPKLRMQLERLKRTQGKNTSMFVSTPGKEPVRDADAQGEAKAGLLKGADQTWNESADMQETTPEKNMCVLDEAGLHKHLERSAASG